MKSFFFILLLVVILVSCSPPSQPAGILAGKVTIGPLSPVERLGETPPPIPAEVFTSRGLNIYRSNGKTLVTSIHFQGDGTYQTVLPSGNYQVGLMPSGIDRAKGFPRTVTISPGQTLILDIEIDTGIR